MARPRSSASSDHSIVARASAAVKKRFRDGYSMSAEEALETPSVWASTGSMPLDRVCTGWNPGGIPVGPTQGRTIHIAGDWSTAKSLLLDGIFKSTQDLGGVCNCSETEGSRDTHFPRAIGLDLRRLEIQRPRTIEEMADMGLEWHAAIRKENPTIPITWGLDSIDSSSAERSVAKGMTEGGGWHMGGGKSEALGEALRRIVQETARYPTTFVMINQIRENVGVMFGPKKRTSGGHAPHFYASLELMLSPSPLGMVRGPNRMAPLPLVLAKRLGLTTFKGQVSDTGLYVGRWIRARVQKTKLGQTLWLEADFFVDFRRGCSKWGGMLQALLREGIVKFLPDGVGIQHRTLDGELLEFDGTQAWLNWLAAHLEELGPRESAPLAAEEEGQ